MSSPAEHDVGVASLGGLALDPLEVHTGFVLGDRRGPAPAPGPALPGGPRAVLAALLEEALAEPPCHVLFSGGRDSAVMLAAATDVARRRGLPPPVALTARFSRQPRAWESDWQERVVGHLGVADWLRFEVTDELDALGPLATDALARHGLFWPPNAHTMLLFAARAAGGTVLTGGGGDELFTGWGWRRPPLSELRSVRPRRRLLKWGPYAMLPLRARQAVGMRAGASVVVPWLRPAGSRLLRERLRRPPARSWRAETDRYLRSRYLECLQTTLQAFAADAGARLVEPFYDARLIRAVQASGPRHGFASRGEALHGLFADLLPRDVLFRSTKATFTEAIWGPQARAFVATWDGRGLDETLADPERVAAAWSAPVPDGRSAAMLHLLHLERAGAQSPASDSS